MTHYIGSISDFLATQGEGAFLPTHETYVSAARDEILIVSHVEDFDDLEGLHGAAVGVSGRDDFLVLLTAPHGEATRHVQLFRKGAIAHDGPLTVEQFGASLDNWVDGAELAFP